MMKKIYLLVLLLMTGVFELVYAGPPPLPPGGGGGGVGPGAPPTTPIDMYQIILLALAIVLISYFYKKYKLKKI